MKKVILLILFTSIVIADIPIAGRPNPGDFGNEDVEILKDINQNLICVKENSESIEEIRIQLEKLNEIFVKILKSLENLNDPYPRQEPL